MNPANFQNMAGQGMVPQGHMGAPQLGGQQRAGPPSQAVQQNILRILNAQQQPNLQGWQASVSIRERAMVIFQLVSQLRLIKAEMDIDQAIHVAITFERRTFFDAPDKAMYDQQCRSKMADIAQTRSKIAQSVQQSVQSGQPQQQMPAMAPNPNQAQMAQRFPNNQMPRPNQPQVIGMPNQPPQIPMGNPQARMPAMPQNPPHTMPPQGQFSQQEIQEINRLSQHMAQSTPPEQINSIRSQLENSPQLQQLHAQGVDPLAHFFRQQATRKYLDMKRNAAQRPSQLVPGPTGVNPEQGRPASQNTARPQGPQATPVSQAQTFDPSFMGSVDQMMAQQRNARRLQEAGQVVVPASNLQGMSEQQRGAMSATPQQPNSHPTGRPPQTPNVSQQSQAIWNAQNQQPHGQPTSQMPNQLQGSNFPNVAPPIPPHLQGQIGGLNASRMQQPNTNMPTLTRGVGPQSQTPQPQNLWPQHGTPQMQPTAQGPPPNPQQNNSNGAPQGPRLPFGKMTHAQIQQHLFSLPPEQRTAIMNQMHQENKNRQAQAERPQSVMMQAQRSKAGPVNSQAINQPPSQTQGHNVNSAQQANGVQSQQLPTHQPGQPQKATQPQGDAAQAARRRQQAALASGSLTIEVERKMDSFGFPPGILNVNNALSKLPPAVTTWGQLKAWVKENSASLPAGSEAKLRGLQGLHYQSLSQKSQPSQQQPGLQPTAPMMPQPNRPPVNAPPQIPNLPQPTLQDVQAIKAQHKQFQSLPDDQVKAMIMKQRQAQWMKARQQGLNPQQQAQMQLMQQQRQHQAQVQEQQQRQQQQNQPSQSNIQSGQLPQVTMAAQKTQPQQTKQASQVKAQTQGKAPQAQMQSQASNKGVKRSSNDDVVEVPDPKMMQQQQRPHAAKTSQKASAPNMRPTQSTQTAQKQDGRMETEQPSKHAQKSVQAQQGNQPTNSAQVQQKNDEVSQLNTRLQEIVDEVTRTTAPPRQPMPTDTTTRMVMIQKLASARAMIIRIDRFIPIYFKYFNDEDSTRDLIRTRQILLAQFKDLSQGTPVETFTISPEELEKSHSMLHKLYILIGQRMNQEKARGGAALNSQGLPLAQQPAKQQPPVLSAANLQQHQNNMQAERQASVQKSLNSSNRAPPAPTSDKPPYPFWPGAQSPHGIPMYGPNELTQDNLKLPTNKKRKTNPQTGSAASTPAQQAGTPLQKPSPRAHKVHSPEMQRAQAPPVFKCSVPSCSTGAAGFASQTDLDKHKMEAHEPKEPVIEDPFQFALEHMRSALNLEKDGKAKSKAEGNAVNPKVEATAMKKSSSMQGTPAMKQETATPMSRAPTLTGPSPASNVLKTPQATTANIKTPASETKSLPKGDATKDSITNTPVIVTSEDPWTDSFIHQDTIHRAFSGLSTLNGPKSWTKIQDYHLTPESTSSAENTDKNSPRPSDISENDLVKISVDVDMGDKSWIPIDWSNEAMTGFEELDLGGDPFGGVGVGIDGEMGPGDLMDLDWETMFGESVEEAEERARKAQRKLARDPNGLPEEWLKVYAPK